MISWTAGASAGQDFCKGQALCSVFNYAQLLLDDADDDGNLDSTRQEATVSLSGETTDETKEKNQTAKRNTAGERGSANTLSPAASGQHPGSLSALPDAAYSNYSAD